MSTNNWKNDIEVTGFKFNNLNYKHDIFKNQDKIDEYKNKKKEIENKIDLNNE